MTSSPSPETLVTGLIFIPEICDNAANDLAKSFDNVIRALGERHINVEESDIKALLYYGKLSIDDIDQLERDYCVKSVHIIGMIGQYKYFSGSEGKCQLVLDPINE